MKENVNKIKKEAQNKKKCGKEIQQIKTKIML